MSKWVLPAWIGLIVVELLIPAGLVLRQEVTLRKGALYEFVIAPVDPVDLFRGRYLELGFFEDKVEMDLAAYQALREQPYAQLSRDSGGKAVLSGLFNNRPTSGDWLRVKKLSYETTEKPGRVRVTVSYPFSRFYVNEKKAPKAEEYFRSLTLPDYALLKVRVLAGNAAVEDLYIGGRPSREWVRTMGK